MKASDYISLAADRSVEEQIVNAPDACSPYRRHDPAAAVATDRVMPPVVKTPPHIHYMPLGEFRSASDATVRAYMAHIRSTYGVTNSKLAATMGISRPWLVEMLQRAGVPHLDAHEGMAMAGQWRNHREQWAAFVTAGMPEPTYTDTTEPEGEACTSAQGRQSVTPPTITLSGVTPDQVAAAIRAILTDCTDEVVFHVTGCKEGESI